MTEAARDRIAELISRAGTRPAPPDAVRAAVFSAVEHEWAQTVAARKGRRLRRALLIASLAVAAVAVGVIVSIRQPPPSGANIATFLAAQGQVEIMKRASDSALVGGESVRAGERVTTRGAGRALFSVAGVSLRVGGDSDVTFERAGEVRLASGRLYVDSGVAQPATAVDGRSTLDILTPLGRVRHVGTQFEVRVQADGVRVREREGTVDVNSPRAVVTLGSTDELAIGSDGSVARTIVTPYSVDWSWTNDLGPEFLIEGRSFDEFLQWYAHESGRRLEFATPAAHAAALATRLSGSIVGLRPDDALAAVAATTRFHCDGSDPSRLLVRVDNPDVKIGGGAKLRADAPAAAADRL
jgi:ferric-dicitrate binding protein FerR (iron transport regulator)